MNTLDVSPRALAIARAIDRLGTGSYIIELEKSNSSEQWPVQISGKVKVQEFRAVVPKEKTEIPRIVENSE